MRKPFSRRGALLLSLCALNSVAQADVKLPSLFSSNMVLQRDKAVPVWGTADPGESVTVKLGTSAPVQTTADANGKWKVMLVAQPVARAVTMSVTGKNALVLDNVAVGEVWVCSGQSNMGFSMGRLRNPEQELQAATNPDLHLFNAVRTAELTPQDDIKGSWATSDPQSAKDFSAVAFFFGNELQRKLGVPVGLIHSSWGGTPAEAWTSREALAAVPELKQRLDESDQRKANYPAALEKYEKETLPAWQTAVDEAKAAGKAAPGKPGAPVKPTDQNHATNLFNGMIAPLIPYGIKGAIWYQGESNSPRPIQYRTLFPTLIRDWRSRFGQGDFPFYWVQLANYQAVQTQPAEPRGSNTPGGRNGWPLLREAQALTLSLPNTGMATAIDLADADNPGDIHPHNKQEVGKRLALVALGKDYGQQQPFEGPMFVSMSLEGAKARLKFKGISGGLKSRGEKLQGFAVKSEGGEWAWADATIEGDTVVVSSAGGTVPVAVRYAWASNPIGNLANGAGLPAIPFRTDTTSVE
ncbi:sialate O-acetylesterase [bacterium]|nr:MAG: sialate O-acetylesterase [bacterium]